MAYEVTATRKRPQSFEELDGQDFVVASLSNSLSSGRIAHAYLFSGPRGVGKTSAARILAKALNCEKGPTATPCGTCANCIEITRGNSLDVIEIDGASNTSVNDVREIRDEVLFSPSSSRYKVYIIDEVHMLSNSAFNALLKTIEEPPPYIVFVFATTEVHKVPATIRSRCQQFSFRLIGIEAIVENLRAVVSEMGLDAEREALFWIAKEASGSLRDAYTLFDQIVSFAESTISMATIQEKLGLVGFERVDTLAVLLAEGNAKGAIETAAAIMAGGVAVEQLINDMTDYYRGVLLAHHGIERESLLGFSPDSFSETVMSRLSVRQIEYIVGELLAFYRAMRYSLSRRYELELLLSKLSIAADYIDPQELVARIEKLRNGLSAAGAPSPASRSVGERRFPAGEADGSAEAGRTDGTSGGVPRGGELSGGVSADAAPSVAPPEFGVSSTVHGADVLPEAQRGKVIDTIRRTRLSLATTLEKTGAWSISGDEMAIPCPSQFHAESIKRELPQIVGAVQAIVGRALRVQVRTAADDVEDENDEETDARVAMIKRVFRGEIVDYGR